MKHLYIILLPFACLLMACNEFLDVKPKGLVIPEKIAHYENLLNSPTLLKTFPINLLDFTDDFATSYDILNQSTAANGYYWRQILNTNEKENPAVWGSSYRCIYFANVIINGVESASDGTPQMKNSVLSEALVTRSACYLDLVTVFAKAYNPETAATDPGLPLQNSINVTDKAPARSTLKETFELMINDLMKSLISLPETNVNKYRATKYTAYGLLSRIYLYMGDYINAEKYTNLALSAPHSLLNYNNYTSKFLIPVSDLNPEILWLRASASGTTFGMVYSDGLKSLFDNSDIRYGFLTILANQKIARYGLPGTENFGITFPELYLTKAELLARAGRYSDAMDIVNNLRLHRIKSASYSLQSASNTEEALIKVFEERRREMAFCGLRWFDMKRLDQDGRMPTVNRVNPDNQVITASLVPHSAKYTFEIPLRVLMFNPEMQLNHK